MAFFLFLQIIFFSNTCASVAFNISHPEQVHLSFGDSPDSMVVMWSSRDQTPHDVTYGKSRDLLDMNTDSDFIKLPEAASKAVPYIHRAVLQNLTQGIQYFYKIRALYPENNTVYYESNAFSFTTLQTNTTRPLRFLVYGDMGVNGAVPTYNMLNQLVESGSYTAIWHIGDFAYDLKDDDGKVGDRFFNKIQSFASRIPYMPSPGNHEIADDFIHYRARFSTPNTPWPIPIDKMWYSYDIGPVHFISYSTEVFFTYNEYYVCKQFDWLLQDLILANHNRDKRPWIIAVAHRPMYCSNSDGDDCTNRFLGRWVRYGLEDLFYAQGVDLIIQAHEHSYERLWPVYKGKVYGHSYVNPRAPVHVISGAAGSQEEVDWMTQGKINAWSAFRADKTSRFTFGQLEIHNTTHLYFEQRESTSNKVLDGIWLIQENHGSFVSNMSCEGSHKHSSCSCPPPILYIYYIVGAALSAILVLIVVLVVFVVYRKKCKHRRRTKVIGNSHARYTQLHEENENEKVSKHVDGIKISEHDNENLIRVPCKDKETP